MFALRECKNYYNCFYFPPRQTWMSVQLAMAAVSMCASTVHMEAITACVTKASSSIATGNNAEVTCETWKFVLNVVPCELIDR